MDTYGWQRSRFGPFGGGFLRFSLGQSTLADLERRSQEAVAKYQALQKRAALIKDDVVREGIIAWAGTADVLGTPSERFLRVKSDLEQEAPWDEIRTGHLDDLETVNAEFEARVAEGEKSGTYGPRGTFALVDGRGKLTSTGVGVVVLAAIGLFLVPLTLK